MRDDQNLLSEVVDTLSRILEPIVIGFHNEETFEDFLKQYGWDIDVSPGDYASLQAVFGVSAIVSQVRDLYEQIAENPDDSEAAFLESLALVSEVLRLVKAVSSQTALTAPFNQASFWDEFLEDLTSDLVQNALKDDYPIAFAILLIVGIFEIEEVTPAEANRITYFKKSILWENLGDLVTDPLSAIKNTYRWGNTVDGFHYTKFFSSFDLFTRQLGFTTGIEEPDPGLLDVYFANGNPVKTDIKLLNVPLVLEVAQGFASYAELGFGVMPITPKGNIDTLPEGFLITPAVKGSVSNGVIGESEALEVGASLSFEDGSLGLVEIRPDSITFVGSNIPSIDASISITGKPELPCIIIGSEYGHRIELEGFFASLGVNGPLNDPEVVFKAGTNEGSDSKRLRFILQAKEGDGFIRDIMGEEPQSIDFSGHLTFSSKSGVSINGNVGFQIQIPLHLTLGVIEVESLTLGTNSNDQGGANIPIGATIVGSFSPLVIVVENIGAEVKLIPTPDKNKSSTLGNLDIGWGFKPPNGVGLSLDAGAIKGGGYLFFDPNREEYAGALELVFSEWITLKAIGLITTKLPDGSKGFSLLIIVTAEFDSGFQLGLGFTLLAVGGLLGLNRTVNIDLLKEGIRTGAIESVMFPEDVIANAPRIISDLRRFFPPQQAIFLVGPLAKIGWGTPALVNAQLGLILEFPSVNITILGVVKVVLPDEEADVLRLQVNFIGRFEPSNKLLWFYAELFDSRVLNITLDGGFGLLGKWGDNDNFVVSVGGFHPRYNPPPLPFPEPPRIVASILNESYARVRIDGYFAITSNSVQFGGSAELFFGASNFKIEGFLNFDALFQFDPFYFSFSLSISLSVKVFGVGLFSVGFSGLLEGITPWHIEGKGRIKILFFINISVPFEHTWGDNQDTKLDPIEVYPLLEAEFNALTNWEAKVPDSSNLLVSLRKLEESDRDQLVLHPVGKLRISQRKVPVNFKLDKIGNQRPLDFDQLEVNASLPGGESLSVSKTTEKFAIGQFKDLDGSSQLSSPAFEPLESGIEIGVAGEQMKTSRAVRRVIRYETIIIDNNFKRRVKTFFGFFNEGYAVLNDFLFTHFLKGNAVSKSVLSKHQKQLIQPFDEVIQVKPNQYSVAFNTNNTPVDAVATAFTSQAKALEHMERQIRNDSGLANRLHVIPNTELNIAA